MKYLSILLIHLIGLFHLMNCQVPYPGRCPLVKNLETFDLDRYMGNWYEYSRYPTLVELGQRCQKVFYKKKGSDSISVTNSGVYAIINTITSIKGKAKVIAPGQLTVSYQNQESDTANYLILGTDYESWAVVYSCRDSLFTNTRFLWILTRKREPPKEAVAAAREVIENNHLSLTVLFKSVQTDCPKPTVSSVGDQISENPVSEVAEEQSTTEASTERDTETV